MTTQKDAGILSLGGKRLSYALTLMLTLAALLLPSNAKADEAWAEYDSGTKTLTFKSGADMPASSGTVTVYELNEGDDEPKWIYKSYTTAVFDESFSKVRPTTCCEWFAGQSTLTNITGLKYFNTEKVTNMDNMFYACSALKHIDVSHFNTANVTDMCSMFYDCKALASVDMSNFNTANVTDMSNMFEGCAKLTTLDLSSFNTENVMYMESMFSGCSALTTICVSDTFDITNVSSSDGMFSGCTELEGAVKYNEDKTDVTMANYTDGYFTINEAWVEYDSGKQTLTFKYGKDKPETNGTVTVYEMNEGANEPEWNNNFYTTVVFDNSFSNARPTTCYYWFEGQETLTSITGLEYLNTAKVTNMEDMFFSCDALKSLDVSNFNTENVTDMDGMFCCCASLECLDLSNFNTANVTNMSGMFSGCTSLKTIYVSDKFGIAKVGDSDNMFYGCTSLAGAKGYTENNIDVSMANYKTGYFTYKGEMWAEYDSSTGTLTFKYGEDMPESNGTVTVYELNKGNNEPEWTGNLYTTVEFDKSFSDARPTTCYEWFFYQTDLTSVRGLEYLNTEKVTNMGEMFSQCYALKSLDVSKFNTENVTDMSDMFAVCAALEDIDLSNFNTASVTNMSGMFGGCSALKTIYVSDKFSTAKVANSDNMFFNCTSLAGAKGYTESDIDVSMANYKTGYFKTYYKVGDTKHDLCGETLSVDKLELEGDKDFMTLAPFTAASATYSRTTSSNWGTLCLPFEVKAPSTGCKFYALKSVDSDMITLTQLDGTIAAGTPMLVSSTDGNGGTASISISASSVNVGKTPADGDQTSGWQLVGSFTETEVPDDGYIISKDKFWLVSELKANITGTKSVKTKAMRAWLKPAANSGAVNSHVLSITLDEENEPTAVDAIEALTEGKTEIYDLQGRRLDSLQKGLNIVKTGNVTKKVMVE